MTPLQTLRAALAAAPVCFVLLDSPPGRHVPVFLDAAARPGRLGSVNAGNSVALYVGGGGLNAAFAAALPQAEAYRELHQALLHQTLLQQAAGGSAHWFYPAASPLQFALVRCPAAPADWPDHEGTVFVDVLAADGRPAGNPDNLAMLYVCPPDGSNYPDAARFLAAVERTAENLMATLRDYNERCVPSLPGLESVQILRLFLFSSGIYRRPDTTVLQVAEAVCKGVLTGLGAGIAGLEQIELPNASGEYRALLAG